MDYRRYRVGDGSHVAKDHRVFHAHRYGCGFELGHVYHVTPIWQCDLLLVDAGPDLYLPGPNDLKISRLQSRGNGRWGICWPKETVPPSIRFLHGISILWLLSWNALPIWWICPSPNMNNMLRDHLDKGLDYSEESWRNVTCTWLRNNRDLWQTWIPDESECSPGFGLYDAVLKQFTDDRNVSNKINCQAGFFFCSAIFVRKFQQRFARMTCDMW